VRSSSSSSCVVVVVVLVVVVVVLVVEVVDVVDLGTVVATAVSNEAVTPASEPAAERPAQAVTSISAPSESAMECRATPSR
jgi:hypothetical protein